MPLLRRNHFESKGQKTLEPTKQMAVGSQGLGKLFARSPNGLPAALGKELLSDAWNHLKKTQNDCYMPAHGSLEHCDVLGYLCQPNGSEIPARRSGWAACTQECLRDQPLTAQLTLAKALNPEERRTSFSLSPFYRCWDGGWGDLPPRGSVRGGISGFGSQLSALCTKHASWKRFGGIFSFLWLRRGKKQTTNTSQLPMKELFLPTNVMLTCLRGTVRISWVRNPYCQLKFSIVPKRSRRRQAFTSKKNQACTMMITNKEHYLGRNPLNDPALLSVCVRAGTHIKWFAGMQLKQIR